MRKRSVLIVFLVLVVLIPICAAENDFSFFTIKAYKSSPGGDNPILMSVYDALTGALNEVGGLNADGSIPEIQDASKVSEINVYPYLDKFLAPVKKEKSNVVFPEGRSNVLFSYLVSGSNAGGFKINITIEPFKRVSAGADAVADPADKINAYYKLTNVNYIFPGRHSTTANGHTISGGKDDKVKGPGKSVFDINWTVSGTSGEDTEPWLAEGIINMFIDENSYEAARSGDYKAFVKVHLSNT